MTDEHDETCSPEASAGWAGEFPRFVSTPAKAIRVCLGRYVRDASASQEEAWRDCIPAMQREAEELLTSEHRGREYGAALEYTLPLESRRADTLFLISNAVVVLEMKGKSVPSQADIDQVAAYARDLKAYHRECQSHEVHAVVVPMRSSSPPARRDDVWVTGPDSVDSLVRELTLGGSSAPPSLRDFLSPDAYRPLPSLVQAARELFHSGEVRDVWRARAATDPAVNAIASIAHEAARTRTRHLVLVTGVPGSGKTLVGMRAVHAHFLDDLAVPRSNGKPTAPGLFLSGNGPLVLVLQHVLRGAGGGGKTFVRHIKDYLDAHVPRPTRQPAEHLLVFDEAQRAFTPDKVAELHKKWPPELVKSEPQLFVELCERIPEWSVLVGLIGSGQEIHLGEEGGLVQWREALESSSDPNRWTVHAPALAEAVFHDSAVETNWDMRLNLDTELRFHTAAGLHDFVIDLLDQQTPHHEPDAVRGAQRADAAYGLGGLRLWATRDLDTGKSYLRDRYSEQPEARFGLLASSRDKLVEAFGVDNSWQATKRARLGPWYADGDESPLSCRRLESCVTEFGAQGLELDMALLAWGSDLIRVSGRWSDTHARRYRRGQVRPRDPYQLRINAYRVLLTRGRDGTVVFVPPAAEMDETWAYLLERGFRVLPG